MAETFMPFGDDRASLQVGGLTVENGPERISLSGSLDVTRDRESLEHAKALRSALDAIVGALEADHALPAKAPQPGAATTTTAKNPFA